MTVLNAHFDGKQVVLDEPMPDGVPAATKLRVLVDVATRPQSLLKIAARAIDASLPADYAEQHEHYVKGTPRR